jgi:hypothetical protein
VEYTPDDDIYRFMVYFGVDTLQTIKDVQARMEELSANSNVYDIGVVKVFDATFIPRDSKPTFYLEDFVSEAHPEVAITVTQDDRGDGYSLFRRNDNPMVDFSIFSEVGDVKKEYQDKILFSHNGGFIAKTRDLPREEVNDLIKVALLEE